MHQIKISRRLDHPRIRARSPSVEDRLNVENIRTPIGRRFYRLPIKRIVLVKTAGEGGNENESDTETEMRLSRLVDFGI